MKTVKEQFSYQAGICILMLLLSSSLTAFSQKKFSVQIGAGLGTTLAKNENANKKGRVMVNINGYYNAANRLSFGVELATTGNFINSVGGSVNEEKFDPATNTITKDGTNMKSYTALAKVKYYFNANKETIMPFAEFGIGATTYYEKLFNISGIDEKKIKRTNMAYQPEIGISFRHFQFSARYLLGGQTPSFVGVDKRGTNVRYESIHISPLFINASWRFDF